MFTFCTPPSHCAASNEAAQWEGGVQKVNKILSAGLQPEWGHEVLHNVLSDLL